MKISAIVLCHNNYYINRVVESIKAQLNNDDEIFVVDDHSCQEVREIIDSMGVQVLDPQEKGNRSANRNLAAKKSNGELLLFVDGDVLLGEGALEIIRNFDYRGISGVCGSVAAMRMTPETMTIENHSYFEKISFDSYDMDYWQSKYPDSRNERVILPWNRFYTAFSIVPRDLFYKAGMFDESFQGWGGEDIDLGYRLRELGKLVILKELCALHIPHIRNIPQEEINGRRNMYKMLDKYRNREMEELISFALTPYVTDGINTVCQRLRELDNSGHTIEASKKELLYHPVSRQEPDGKIEYYVSGKKKEEAFLGLALPFDDGCFEGAVTTTHIFDYPKGIATRILQELIRAASSVRVIKYPSRNVEWGEIESTFKYVFCYYKTYLFADTYEDFSIKDMGEYYLVERALKRRD